MNRASLYLSSKTYGAILPHAGIRYAGDCRRSCFNLLRDDFKDASIERIIYISAYHNGPLNGKKIYQFYKDKNFEYTFQSSIEVNLPENLASEHSFIWVRDELKTYFPDADILVLTPETTSNIKLLSLDIYSFLKNHPNTLLLGTTDLSHVGTKFQTFLQYPQQNQKIIVEESIINYMIDTRQNYQDILTFKPKINMCGLTSVKVILLVAKHMGWLGRVVDYYDSRGSTKTQKLDRYVIDSNPVDEFVSYVSVAYGHYTEDDMKIVLPFDIYMGIGLSKSIIVKNTMLKKYDIKIPTWSILNRKFNGVFVGTGLVLNNEKITNCSYGRFEETNKEKMSILEKIKQASIDCPRDALKRWGLPYTPRILNRMTYKLEILDLKENWIQYPALEAPDRFKYDGKHGMYLETLEGSATFLPVVARENPDWSIHKYMAELSKKATNNTEAWKNPKSVMHIYRSRSFTFDPRVNRIHKN